MTINEKLMALKNVVNCDVAPDEYDGKDNKFITFTYEDERPTSHGNNRPTADTSFLMVQYHTPKQYDYLEDKKTIRNYLEANGFKVNSIQSWLVPALVGTERTRTTTFTVTYTEQRA